MPGGEGMARLADGRIGFAAGVAPGDSILVEGVVARRSWIRATSWQLIAGGAERVEPSCRWYDRCGGCDWMHLSIGGQQKQKARLALEALKRIGKIACRSPEVVASPATWRYRRRLRFHIDAQGRMGLFARGSHNLVEMDDCLVARSEIMEELGRLREHGRRHRAVLAEFASVEIRVSECAPRIGLFWQARGAGISAAARRFIATLPNEHCAAEVSTEQSVVCQTWMDRPPTEVVVPLRSFVQVNARVNARLTDTLLRHCEQQGVSSFIELYCGSGNLTLPMLATGLVGRAVELDSAAIRAARAAALRQGFDPETFVCCDAAAGMPARIDRPDLMLLDPPRSGAAAALHHVARISPPHVAIVACDPATLARDLRCLSDSGYRLVQLACFDMFPQTHHVELFAWLSR